MTIRDAWNVLRTLPLRHLPVVNADGGLVGIVSDSHFATSAPSPPLRELLVIGTPSLEAPISSIMTGAPISIQPDEDVEEAADLMIQNQVGALPVVGREGEVVGIVSRVDVMRILLEESGPSL